MRFVVEIEVETRRLRPDWWEADAKARLVDSTLTVQEGIAGAETEDRARLKAASAALEFLAETMLDGDDGAPYPLSGS